MSSNLLSLPPELLLEIASLALLSHNETPIFVSTPRTRFTYQDPPSPSSCEGSLEPQDNAFSSTSPARTPPKKLTSIPQTERSTRSSFYRSLPQRPYNPHHTCTTISLLLVSRQLHALSTPIYYSHHAWAIGIHGRTPTISTFRHFLAAIGPLARRSIRTVVVYTRYGYDCYWNGLPSAWVALLRRCEGLTDVRISMTRLWGKAIMLRDVGWRARCVEAWRRKGLEKITTLGPWQSGVDIGNEEVPSYVATILDRAFRG